MLGYAESKLDCFIWDKTSGMGNCDGNVHLFKIDTKMKLFEIDKDLSSTDPQAITQIKLL